MIIGYDAKRLYNNFTGLGNYSRTLLSNLAEYATENNYLLYTPSIREEKETISFLKNPAFNTITPKGSFKSYWRSFSIGKDLKKDKIELFHGLSNEIPVGLQKKGIKTVVTIHDVFYKTFPQMFNAVDRKIYDFKFNYCCKNADKIIAISESTKKDIITFFNVPEEKIEVIYQPVNSLYYNLQSEEKVINQITHLNLPLSYMLYIGTINSRKNLLGIVKAYTLLPPDLQIPLLIVGRGGSYKKEVIAFAEKNSLTDKLIFLDNISDTLTLQALYQQAEVFIFPSFYEGFGLPVVEAMLSKTPVITSNVSSLPEAGGNNTLYVCPFKVEEIAESIQKTLTDTKLRQKMIEEGYRYAQEKFSPATLTKQVNNLYNDVVNL